MAVRLLKAALPQPLRGVDEAIRLVEYHARRNAAAKRSHVRRWSGRHPDLELVPLVGNDSDGAGP